MKYVTTLYVEGGDRDGDTLACGPYDTEREAHNAGDVLEKYGSILVLPLERGSLDVEKQL